MHVFDAANGELVTTIEDPDPGFRSFGLEIAAVGNLLAVSNPNSDNADVRVYDPATGSLVQTIASDIDAVSGDLGSVGGKLIVADPFVVNDDGSRGAVFVYDIVPEPHSLTLAFIGCMVALRWRVRRNREGCELAS